MATTIYLDKDNISAWTFAGNGNAVTNDTDVVVTFSDRYARYSRDLTNAQANGQFRIQYTSTVAFKIRLCKTTSVEEYSIDIPFIKTSDLSTISYTINNSNAEKRNANGLESLINHTKIIPMGSGVVTIRKIDDKTETSSSSATTGGVGNIYKSLDATNKTAGSHHLADDKWDVSKSQIDYFSIYVASGTVNDYDVQMYEESNYSSTSLRYEVKGLNSSLAWTDDIEWMYIDKSEANQIHLKITENSGTGTYNIYFKGLQLS